MSVADHSSARRLPPRKRADAPAPPARAKMLRVRMSSDEWDELGRRAAAANMTMSDYVRAKALRGHRAGDVRDSVTTAKSRHVETAGALASTIAAMSTLARQMAAHGNLINQIAARLNSGDEVDGANVLAAVREALEQHAAAQALVRQAMVDMARRVPVDDE